MLIFKQKWLLNYEKHVIFKDVSEGLFYFLAVFLFFIETESANLKTHFPEWTHFVLR